jgi:hypothetical protein
LSVLSNASAWQNGRSSAFGFSCDSTPVNNGACHNYNPSMGHWIGAISDTAPQFMGPECVCQDGKPSSSCQDWPKCPNQGSCGTRWEIACVGKWKNQKDTSVCKPGVSIVIAITDACPHNHPVSVSNCKKGWCWCNDGYPHFDLGCGAFLALTNSLQTGVIAMKFRQVDQGTPLGLYENGSLRSVELSHGNETLV